MPGVSTGRTANRPQLWDDQYLYIGYWIEEPYVEAALVERDSLIFMENDVEVFIERPPIWKSAIQQAWKPALPKEGDVWRIFFGRFEKLEVAGALPQPQPAWCWNKHGVLDTHRPECFPHAHFSTQDVADLGG